MRTEKQTIIVMDNRNDNVVVRIQAGTLRVVGADGNELVIARESGGASGPKPEDNYSFDRLVVQGGNPSVELWMGTRARSDTIRVYSGPESGSPAQAPDADVPLFETSPGPGVEVLRVNQK